MTRLSVLEQSAAAVGRTHSETLAETVALAPFCEKLGYHGYWVTEHHNSAALVGSAPEVLIAAIAAITDRIPVGAAGVMLSHYAPYKVAEQFQTLAALYPGRIKLGFGRSRGTDRAQAALRGYGEDFAQEAAKLLAYLGGDTACLGETLHAIQAMPQPAAAPAPYCLASSQNGAHTAAALGLPMLYNYSDGAANLDAALEIYRREFVPSVWAAQPSVGLSVWALAAETEDEARHLFWSRAYWRAMLMRGQRVPMLPPDEAAAFAYTDAERADIAQRNQAYFVGTADQVADGLKASAKRAGAEELLIFGWAHDPAKKRKSLEFLAAAFGL